MSVKIVTQFKKIVNFLQLRTARTTRRYRYLQEIQKSERQIFDSQLRPLQYIPTYGSVMSANSPPNEENGVFSPIIPLIIEKEPEKDGEKTKYIQLEIKARAGRDFPTTYKKYVRRFDDGTPYEFVTLIHDLQEIFL